MLHLGANLLDLLGGNKKAPSVESSKPRTVKSGLDVIAEEVTLAPTPTRGRGDGGGGRATGSRQIPSRSTHTSRIQIRHHHTTPRLLVSVTRMNRLSPAVSCAWWLGENVRKSKTALCFQVRAVP